MSEESRSSKQKEKIMKKAAQLFLRHGYEKVTVNDIAKTVGIQGPGFYHYFKSKEDLLSSILDTTFQISKKDMIDVMENVVNPEEKINTLISNVIKLTIPYGEIPLLVDDSLGGRFKKIKKEREKQIVNSIRQGLKELAESKFIEKPINLAVATFSLIGMTVWIYKWYNPKGKLSIEQLTAEVTRFFYHGFYGKGED
jgi:AcrR family transcriptional regulator